MPFELDPVLANDTVALADTTDYAVRLANDKRFPWVIVIPRVASITEVYQLDTQLQQKLAADASVLGRELMELFKGDSLNTGALGNVVRQLHLHHVVRFETDVAWPAPVWGFGKPVAYSPDELQLRVDLLQRSLSITTG